MKNSNSQRRRISFYSKVVNGNSFLPVFLNLKVDSGILCLTEAFAEYFKNNKVSESCKGFLKCNRLLLLLPAPPRERGWMKGCMVHLHCRALKISGLPNTSLLSDLYLVKTSRDSLDFYWGILLHLLLSSLVAYSAYKEINSFCEALFLCSSDCLNAFLFPCQAVRF